MRSECSFFWRILDRFGARKWQKRMKKMQCQIIIRWKLFDIWKCCSGWTRDRNEHREWVERSEMLHFYLIHLMSYKLTWMSMPLIWNFHLVTVLTMGRIVLWGGIWLWKASITVIKNPNAQFYREMKKTLRGKVKKKKVFNSSSFFWMIFQWID